MKKYKTSESTEVLQGRINYLLVNVFTVSDRWLVVSFDSFPETWNFSEYKEERLSIDVKSERESYSSSMYLF